jgi:cephalosporin-C deacetylase
MAEFDLPLEELTRYLPARDEPEDFKLFWKQTLGDSRAHPIGVRAQLVDVGLTRLTTLDVSFRGYQGHPVHAWLILPDRQPQGPLPVVVQYLGYGGGRGWPGDHLLWASAGYAHLVMDTRGQGSDTRDLGDATTAAPGEVAFVTRGAQDHRTYYYRRVLVDAVRAVEAVRTFAEVDRDRIAVGGASQGGGIALAVAALEPAVSALMVDIPFLCHWPRAVRVAERPPYADLAELFARRPDRAERTLATLRYFDGVNFAAQAGAPALFSVALLDRTCPPSTVFAAYNHYGGDKDIAVYPFNDHEGGGSLQVRAQLRWLAQRLPAGNGAGSGN